MVHPWNALRALMRRFSSWNAIGKCFWWRISTLETCQPGCMLGAEATCWLVGSLVGYSLYREGRAGLTSYRFYEPCNAAKNLCEYNILFYNKVLLKIVHGDGALNKCWWFMFVLSPPGSPPPHSLTFCQNWGSQWGIPQFKKEKLKTRSPRVLYWFT